MTYQLTGWYSHPQSNGEGATNLTAVDARVRGGLMVLCEFAGNECDPDKRRKCKHYDKSRYRDCCMYYHDDDVGNCDCIKS